MKRKPLKEPYVATLTITWSGTMEGDGVLTMTPNMLVDKALDPFDYALANNQIRDFEAKINIDLLKEAKELIKKSKRKY